MVKGVQADVIYTGIPREHWSCSTVKKFALKVLPKTQLEGCIMWNDTIQYSPEAVRYPCTSCFLPAFDDA